MTGTLFISAERIMTEKGIKVSNVYKRMSWGSQTSEVYHIWLLNQTNENGVSYCILRLFFDLSVFLCIIYFSIMQ